MKGYRGDINALRALAIVSVVAFHFKLGVLSGGFGGVDVFFVVSGFLMTAIIWDRLEDGSFSLAGFYMARVRRIVPALTAMCAVLLGFGWFWLDPLSLSALAEQARSALLFYSNVMFWLQAGYFDAASDSKLLLHTWSLSVEWQFYILYPCVLMLLHRAAPKLAKHVILLGAILSFCLAVFLSKLRPELDFYLLPSRAWEMAAGGLPHLYRLSYRVPPRLRPWLAAAGGLTILLSLLLVTSKLPWPGLPTLPIVLGTSAVLVARYEVRWVFEQPIVKSIGLWSYSIYLWHWPLLVLMGYFEMTSPALRFAAIGIVVLLAAVSYHGIERNGLRWVVTTRPRLLAGAAALFTLCIVTSGSISAFDGFPGRHGGNPQKLAEIAEATTDWTYPLSCGGLDRSGGLKSCSFGKGPRRVMLFGDSYAQQIYSLMAKISADHPDLFINSVTAGGCPPVPGGDLTSKKGLCSTFNRLANHEALSGHYDVVIIASIWAPYFMTDSQHPQPGAEMCFDTPQGCVRPETDAAQRAGFDAAFNRLTDFASSLNLAGVTVILMEPTPFPGQEVIDIPHEVAKREFLGQSTADLNRIDLDDFKRRTAYIRKSLEDVAAHSGAILYDPTTALCQSGSCPMLDQNGVPLYFDRVHLRSSVVAAAPFGDLVRHILGSTVAGRLD